MMDRKFHAAKAGNRKKLFKKAPLLALTRSKLWELPRRALPIGIPGCEVLLKYQWKACHHLECIQQFLPVPQLFSWIARDYTVRITGQRCKTWSKCRRYDGNSAMNFIYAFEKKNIGAYLLLSSSWKKSSATKPSPEASSSSRSWICFRIRQERAIL